MTQSRVIDYGAPVIARTLKNMIKSFAKSAVLEGCDFAVDAPNRLRITPGTIVTDRGVMIIESEPKFLIINNSTAPADYTIYYTHDDKDITGGEPAELTMDSGLLDDAAVAGTVLGYVRYPGLAVSLSTSQFSQKQKLQMGVSQSTNSNSDWVIPLKGVGYTTTNISGTINITDVWEPSPARAYAKIRNNGLVAGNISLVFPFKVKDLGYGKLQFLASLDVNTTTTVAFIDSASSVSILASAMLGDPSYVLYDLTVPKSTVQSSNSLVYVMLQFTIAAGKEIRLQAIGLNEYSLPV